MTLPYGYTPIACAGRQRRLEGKPPYNSMIPLDAAPYKKAIQFDKITLKKPRSAP